MWNWREIVDEAEDRGEGVEVSAEELASQRKRGSLDHNAHDEARPERRTESRMAEVGLSDAEKTAARGKLRKEESADMREARKRFSVRDFVSLSVVGKGAFGEVRLVRKKDGSDVLTIY